MCLNKVFFKYDSITLRQSSRKLSSGPLLYSIFVNDMPLILQKAHSVLYADDTTIYASTKNIIHLNSILQNELM